MLWGFFFVCFSLKDLIFVICFALLDSWSILSFESFLFLLFFYL